MEHAQASLEASQINPAQHLTSLRIALGGINLEGGVPERMLFAIRQAQLRLLISVKGPQPLKVREAQYPDRIATHSKKKGDLPVALNSLVNLLIRFL
jgi:hypothetical protein